MTPSSPADQRWARLTEAASIGARLAPEEEAFLRQHVPDDPVLRAERALREGMGDWGSAPFPGEDDSGVLAAVLAAHVTGGSSPSSSPRRGRWWIAGGLAVAAAVILAVVGRPGAQRGPRDGGSSTVAAAPTPAPAMPAASAAVDDGRLADAGAIESLAAVATLRALSGTWNHEDGTALSGPPAAGVTLIAASEACLGDPRGGRLCARPGARLRVVEADVPTVEWLDGQGELVTPAEAPEAVVMELRVAGTRVSGLAARVEVQTTNEGRWSLAVHEGEVELQTDRGVRTLVAGERWSPDVPGASVTSSRTRGTPDAGTLLQQARAARAAGDMAQAARLYRRLTKAHPRSALAGPAWVALGQVELARGRARSALFAFERHRGGPLSEEVAYGRIEALRRLGRTREARAATERFLSKYPGSSYAAKLRKHP